LGLPPPTVFWSLS